MKALDDVLLSLIRALADGGCHSGESLGLTLGLSRAAVWKRVQQLQAYGLTVDSVKGRGYRLPASIELLCPNVLADAAEQSGLLRSGMHVFSEVDSTNAFLMRRWHQGLGHGEVCFAEWQSSGRGRRGREWVSPFGANIYFSMGWRFSDGLAVIEGLSLAVGVVIVKVLNQLSLYDAKLKWPNDLLFQDKKIGGVLIELSGDPNGDCFVVVGLGLNVSMSKLRPKGVPIDQSWSDLDTMSGGRISRNEVCRELIVQMSQLLSSYPAEGFEKYRHEWEAHHAFLGRKVVLSSPSGDVSGIALGVSSNGSLRLEIDGGEQSFSGGEVSLRIEQ